MVFGCDAIVDTLPYGPALLKESLAFMGFVEDQWEITPKGALVRHPKDHLLLSAILSNYSGVVKTLSSLLVL